MRALRCVHELVCPVDFNGSTVGWERATGRGSCRNCKPLMNKERSSDSSAPILGERLANGLVICWTAEASILNGAKLPNAKRPAVYG